MVPLVCTACSTPGPDHAAQCSACGAVRTIDPVPPTADDRGRIDLEELPGRGPEKAGTLIAGRYEVISLLGKGGMGLVYRARDRELKEEVAIKVLQPSYTQDPTDVERLKREIITARRVTHANIIRIHDFGL